MTIIFGKEYSFLQLLSLTLSLSLKSTNQSISLTIITYGIGKQVLIAVQRARVSQHFNANVLTLTKYFYA